MTICIDVNFGDPIWPAPTLVEVPRLLQLGQDEIRLLGNPLTMVLAEKIITMLDRGEANTRWRDFADVYTLTRARPVDASELRASFETVARYRGVELRPILPGLAGMPALALARWAAWRRRIGRLDALPQAFDEVLAALSVFADPVRRYTTGAPTRGAGTEFDGRARRSVNPSGTHQIQPCPTGGIRVQSE